MAVELPPGTVFANDFRVVRPLSEGGMGAVFVVEQLSKVGIQAAAIHGNKSQSARERALGGFRTGQLRLLIATDIAARGIDVEGISHVINYDLPNVPETYVHRIGRTARAGAAGIALSFCEREEHEYLRDIERLIQKHIPRVEEHAFASPERRPPPTDLTRRGGGGGGGAYARPPESRPQHGGGRSGGGYGHNRGGHGGGAVRDADPRPFARRGRRPDDQGERAARSLRGEQ